MLGCHRASGPKHRAPPPPPDLCSDVDMHGFVMSVRLTWMPPSHHGQDLAKILKKHKKEKQVKYLEHCLMRHCCHFTC
jgi:hypothetical protein